MSQPATDKLLLTPGPLTTSDTVKQAQLRDVGSRDTEFIQIVRDIRAELLAIAGVSVDEGYEAVLLQGSGTYTLEAVLTCGMPPAGKLLAIVNGAYGDRVVKMAHVHGIATTELRYAENAIPQVDDVAQALAADPDLQLVAAVHCETTSGIMNPIADIGQVVAAHGRRYFVDSMSAFGAVACDFRACHIDYLVSSANKCIEGVPGFAFVICRRDALRETEGQARTLSLDLHAQWQGLEANGQFRFTPPTHALLAFRQALRELAAEGGVAGRGRRYAENHRVLTAGMRELGFVEYVPRELQGYVITSYHYPAHPDFEFPRFYNLLSDRGFAIYPGKVTNAECFRVGNIGHIFPEDIRRFLSAVEEVLAVMGCRSP